jgi:hypothetical protein
LEHLMRRYFTPEGVGFIVGLLVLALFAAIA